MKILSARGSRPFREIFRRDDVARCYDRHLLGGTSHDTLAFRAYADRFAIYLAYQEKIRLSIGGKDGW